MFCQKCGAQTAPGASFCSVCGTTVSAPSQAAPPQPPGYAPLYAPPYTPPPYTPPPQGYAPHPAPSQWPSPGGKTVIKRSNAKAGTIVGGWVGIGMSLIVGIIFLVFALGKNTFADFLKTFDMRSSVASKVATEMKPFLAFLAFLMFFSIVVQTIKTIMLAKTFVCACEDCVYGVAGKALYFSTQPFELRYEQITSVSRGNPMVGNIKITCGPVVYGAIIDNPDEMVSMIYGKMGQRYY